MKNLRTRFERFCYLNRHRRIPNLMLYIAVGTAIVYVMSQISGNYFLYNLLYFDRTRILHGEVWRLFTYPLTYGGGSSNVLLIGLSLFCYYYLGNAMERTWGTLKFNLFYLTGVVLMDVYCMVFGGYASVTYLNMSLFLGFATMHPDASFLLFFIIPIKAWFFALFDLALVALDLVTLSFPSNLFSIISLANYFLFFGSDVVNLLPLSWRLKLRRKMGKPSPQPRVIHFAQAKPKQPEKPNYNHRCTVCGRTDVSNPELEFRYCSRCNGFYCYCEDHISSHVHID